MAKTQAMGVGIQPSRHQTMRVDMYYDFKLKYFHFDETDFENT